MPSAAVHVHFYVGTPALRVERGIFELVLPC
jgi:hypothetical protein